LVVLVVVGVGVSISRAEATGHRPCANLEISYSLHTVEPGQVFDYSIAVENCSNRPRTIRVRIGSFGPCDFPHPSTATYKLPAHLAVQADALVVAPSCRGRYRVSGKAIIRGTVVARAHAGFTVLNR
jgi:hypothetical protein